MFCRKAPNLANCLFSASLPTSLFRYICLCSTLKKKEFNVLQRTKLAKKFLAREIPFAKKMKKGPCINTGQIPTSNSLSTKNMEYRTGRMVRLGKIFLEKVTEALSISDIAYELTGYGIEITQARVLSGYAAIHIYWHCSDPSKDAIVHELLSKMTPTIRRELIQQQLLGRVPPLLFVRDSAHKNVAEVERCLQLADFGEDFQPAYKLSHSVAAFTIKKELNDSVFKAIDDISAQINENTEADDYLDNLLPIRKNVFGVDRGKIMEMVERGIKASGGNHRVNEDEVALIQPQIGTGTLLFSTSSSCSFARTKEIRKWVADYKRAVKKTVKRETNVDNKMLSYIPNEENAFEEPFEEFEEIEKNTFEFEEEFSDYDESL